MRVLSVSVPLPSPDDPNTMAPLARQHDALRQLGVDVRTLEIRGPSKVKYLSSLPSLRRELDSIDVVHGHYGFAGWLARAQIKKPVVVSFMGSDLLGTPRASGGITRSSALVVQANRLSARSFDAVIVKSEQMAEIIRPVESHVIPNGVDTEEFAPRPTADARAELGWEPPPAPRVLFAGNPSNPRKGYALARAAVDRYNSDAGTHVELVALNGVPASDVPTYMNASDVMIMASIFEGSPNVVKEAMACDLPVVSVPVGDVRFLLGGVEGYAVVERDPQALADALRTALRGDHVVAGRDAVLSKGLDGESVARRIVDVYESLLG